MKTFYPGVRNEVDLDDFLYFIGWSIFILLISSEVNSENDTFLGNHASHLNVQRYLNRNVSSTSPSVALLYVHLVCLVL